MSISSFYFHNQDRQRDFRDGVLHRYDKTWYENVFSDEEIIYVFWMTPTFIADLVAKQPVFKNIQMFVALITPEYCLSDGPVSEMTFFVPNMPHCYAVIIINPRHIFMRDHLQYATGSLLNCRYFSTFAIDVETLPHMPKLGIAVHAHADKKIANLVYHFLKACYLSVHVERNPCSRPHFNIREFQHADDEISPIIKKSGHLCVVARSVYQRVINKIYAAGNDEDAVSEINNQFAVTTEQLISDIFNNYTIQQYASMYDLDGDDEMGQFLQNRLYTDAGDMRDLFEFSENLNNYEWMQVFLNVACTEIIHDIQQNHYDAEMVDPLNVLYGPRVGHEKTYRTHRWADLARDYDTRANMREHRAMYEFPEVSRERGSEGVLPELSARSLSTQPTHSNPSARPVTSRTRRAPSRTPPVAAHASAFVETAPFFGKLRTKHPRTRQTRKKIVKHTSLVPTRAHRISR